MKLLKTIKLGLFLFIMTATLFSCNKAGQQSNTTNHFTFSGNDYDIDGATITYDGTEKFLVFYGPGITTNASMTEFLGSGNGLSFSIHSSGVTGVYTYSAAVNPALGSYEDSEFSIGSNLSSGGSIYDGLFNSGTIEIQPGTSGGYKVIVTDPFVDMYYEGPLQVGNFQ